MKSWKSSLALVLGLLTASVRAQEQPWRPQPLRPGDVSRILEESSPSTPAVILQRPVVALSDAPSASVPGAPQPVTPPEARPELPPGVVAISEPVPQDQPGGPGAKEEPRRTNQMPVVFQPPQVERKEAFDQVRAQSVEGEPAPTQKEVPATSDYSNRMFHWEPAHREPPPGQSPEGMAQPSGTCRQWPRCEAATASQTEGTAFIPRQPAAGPENLTSTGAGAPQPPAVLPPGDLRAPPAAGPATDGGVCCPFERQPILEQAAESLADHFYGRAEYLLWWTRGSSLPPLVTTGTGNVADNPGSLAAPGTLVLIGNQNVANQARSGGRFQLGYWLFDDHNLGLEVSGFFLGQQRETFSVTSLGATLLARPVQTAADGWREISLLQVQPPNQAGRIDVSHTSTLWGAGLEGRHTLFSGSGYNIDLLAGYRTLGLNEDLTIDDLSVTTGTLGQTLFHDRFSVRNQFHGGQLGMETTWLLGPLSLNLTGQLALGSTVQNVDVSGVSVLSSPATGTVVYPAGILAAPSNIGNHTRAVVSVVPEVGVNIGYQLTDSVRAYVGYDFLYWNNVVRPGNQIDRTVNLAQIPVLGGPAPTVAFPARPSLIFHGTDFWAQGVHFGLEFRY